MAKKTKTIRSSKRQVQGQPHKTLASKQRLAHSDGILALSLQGRVSWPFWKHRKCRILTMAIVVA